MELVKPFQNFGKVPSDEAHRFFLVKVKKSRTMA
jgi:hypothetical protein